MRRNGLVLLIASSLIGVGWFAFADSPETPEQVQKLLQQLKKADKEIKKLPLLPPLDIEETKQPTPAADSAPAKAEAPGKADEDLLQKAGLKTDGPALLEFFRSRTLRDEEREGVARRIRQLGAESYRQREQAYAALTKGGPRI